MLEIKNTEVYGLERSLVAAGNAKSMGEINTAKSLDIPKGYSSSEWEEDPAVARGKRLGKAPVGSAHDHFLCGIIVQFDIKYPLYWTPEYQRYHFENIITSQSKQHRLIEMASSPEFDSMFNKYVDPKAIYLVKTCVDMYKLHMVHDEKDKAYEWFMKALSNLPAGFESWMTCTSNYLSLKTIYFQRRNHRLQEDWGAFCDWCETLPMFKELVGITK